MSLTYVGGELAQFMLSIPAAAIQVFQGMLLFFLLSTDLLVSYKVSFTLGTNSSTPGNANSNVVSLLSRRKTSANPSAIPVGAYEIGKARVYSFGLRNTPYVDNSSQWNLHLFDVQTYTFITLNLSLIHI